MAGEERELTIRLKGALTPEAFTQAREELKKLGLETDVVKTKGKGLEDQFKSTSSAGGLLDQTFVKLTASFSASRIIDSALAGLGNFARGAVAAAGHIVDLSDKLGISTDFIQKFDFVGKQAGVTVDDFGNAAFKLSINVSKGGAAVDSALRQLGLTRDMLKSLKPEEQFDLVARKLGGLTDVQERNRLGVELMGKGYSGIAAAVATYAQNVDKATTVDEKHLRAIDDAADAYTRLIDTIEKKFVHAIGDVALGYERGRAAGLGFWRMILEANAGTLQATVLQREQALILAELAKKSPDYGKDIALAAEKPRVATLGYADALKAAQGEIDKLDKGKKAEIDAGLKLGATIDDLAEKYHLSSDAARIYVGYQQEIAQASKAAAEAAKKQAEEEGKASDARRKAFEDFHQKTIIFAGTSTSQNSIIGGSIDIKRDLVKPYESLTDVMKSSTSALDELIKRGPNLKDQLVPPIDSWKSFKTELADLPDVLIRSFEGGGNPTKAIGASIGRGLGASLIGSSSDWTKVLTSKGLGAFAGIAGAAVSGVATMGISLAVTGAIAGIQKLVKNGKNETKADREEFAKQLGFNDLSSLYVDLQKLGDQGEKLADAGMHVVGKHDQAANEAWMKEVSDFYDDVHAKQAQMLEDLGGLEQQFHDMGATVPDDLDAIVKGLIAAGKTDEAQRGVDDLRAAYTKYTDAVAKTEAFKTIEQEMKDVGLTADDMNASFRQAADEESARTIAKQWADLRPYVNDVNMLADKYLDQIQRMVIDSRSYGTSIPESMRPLLENLAAQGKLLDANGEKLTDLSLLNFEEDPLQKSFDEFNLTLKDIRDILKNDLPGAFDTIGDHGEDAARRTKRAFDDLPTDIDITVRPHMEGLSHVPGAGFDEPPVLDQPVRRVTRSGFAYLNPGDIAGMPHLGGLGAAASSSPQHFHLYLDGREIAGFTIDTVNTGIATRQIQVTKGVITARGPYG